MTIFIFGIYKQSYIVKNMRKTQRWVSKYQVSWIAKFRKKEEQGKVRAAMGSGCKW